MRHINFAQATWFARSLWPRLIAICTVRSVRNLMVVRISCVKHIKRTFSQRISLRSPCRHGRPNRCFSRRPQGLQYQCLPRLQCHNQYLWRQWGLQHQPHLWNRCCSLYFRSLEIAHISSCQSYSRSRIRWKGLKIPRQVVFNIRTIYIISFKHSLVAVHSSHVVCTANPQS